MSAWMLAASWLTPLLMLPWASTRRGPLLAAFAALPALATALVLPVGTRLEIPWLLLGTSLHLDATAAGFLLFSAVMWLGASLYAALGGDRWAGGSRFTLFYLLAGSGNFLLVIAADFVTFYVGFALMGLAATGLVAQRRSQRARRAARVYLGWTLVGEMALFAAVALLADSVSSLRFADLGTGDIPHTVVALLLFGFGIKLALPGLHVWLPLAYPAAPPVAAAVLSGPMISAGLLGWLRFLPPGDPSLAAWGQGLTVIGTAGVALGVLAGITQRDPRAVLGYSSVAKMGLLSAAFGVALAQPAAAGAISAALIAFALHHLMLKGALFLGLGEWQRRPDAPWLFPALAVLALALVGVPLTSGAGAKLLLDDAVVTSGVDAGLLFAFATLGTVLLMARLLWLIHRRPAPPVAGGGIDRATIAWLCLGVTALLLPLARVPLTTASSGWLAILAGAALAAVLAAPRAAAALTSRGVPAGDLLYLGRVAHRLFGRTGGRRRPETGRRDRMTRRLAGLGWLTAGVLGLTLLLAPG